MPYGNGGSGYPQDVAKSATPTRQPIIANQLGLLDKNTEVLNQHIAELEQRLRDVLSPETTISNAVNTASPAPNVPLGATLVEINGRLERMAGRLRGLMACIEL